MPLVSSTCPQCRGTYQTDTNGVAPVACPSCGHPVAAVEATPAAWFLTRNGEKYGPYSVPQLKQLATKGNLVPDDLLWREGLPAWVKASTVGEVFPRPPSLPPRLPIPDRRDPSSEDS